MFDKFKKVGKQVAEEAMMGGLEVLEDVISDENEKTVIEHLKHQENLLIDIHNDNQRIISQNKKILRLLRKRGTKC